MLYPFRYFMVRHGSVYHALWGGPGEVSTVGTRAVCGYKPTRAYWGREWRVPDKPPELLICLRCAARIAKLDAESAP